jgi:iron complex outermembrane receptor protein
LQVSEYRGSAQAYIINAAQSRIYGLEDSLHFELNEYFQVNAAGAWTHARYVQFGTESNGVVTGAPIYATCPTNPALLPPLQAQGNCTTGGYAYVNISTILHQVPMQHAPDYTATLGPRVSTGMTDTGEYALTGSLYYTSKIFMGPCGCQFLQPAYVTLDVRGQWTPPSKKYYVAFFGENITNDRYRNQVQYNGSGIGAGWSAPAIWGIELGAKF